MKILCINTDNTMEEIDIDTSFEDYIVSINTCQGIYTQLQTNGKHWYICTKCNTYKYQLG